MKTEVATLNVTLIIFYRDTELYNLMRFTNPIHNSQIINSGPFKHQAFEWY